MPKTGRLAVAAMVMAGACGGGDPSDSSGAAADPVRGKKVYSAKCALCHGADLRGTSRGPSQLSKVYEPSHHPDASYRSAIANGVAAHHWRFGSMPAVAGLSDSDVESVIAYIRAEQAKQGFEPYPPAK